MRKISIKRFLCEVISILVITLFFISPFKLVKAYDNNTTEITDEVVDEKNQNNYSTLYTGFIISLLSLGLVFLNKKDIKKEK